MHTRTVENLPSQARSHRQTSARMHILVGHASVATPLKPVHLTRPKQAETGYKTG